MFASDGQKREFLKPKIERLCQLMDAEYKVNVDRLRKQKEEQRRAQAQRLELQQRSRAAQLANGYVFKNPTLNQRI